MNPSRSCSRLRLLLVLTLAVTAAAAGASAHAASPPADRVLSSAPRSIAHGVMPAAVSFSETLAAQKMLAQRVVQAYARTGLRVDPAGGAAALAAAVDAFNNGLAALEASLPGEPPRAGIQDPVRQSLWMLSGQWADARAVVAERPTIHAALRLAGKMDGALATMDRLGIELADRIPPGATTSVNALLVRQAELSQRIARAYWLRRLGDDSVAAVHELEAAGRAMRANLAMLRAHPERDAQDTAALDRIETEIGWLLTAIETEGAASYPLVVSSAAEQVVAQVAEFGATLAGRP